jgi:hypothetical protein
MSENMVARKTKEFLAPPKSPETPEKYTADYKLNKIREIIISSALESTGHGKYINSEIP